MRFAQILFLSLALFLGLALCLLPNASEAAARGKPRYSQPRYSQPRYAPPDYGQPGNGQPGQLGSGRYYDPNLGRREGGGGGGGR